VVDNANSLLKSHLPKAVLNWIMKITSAVFSAVKFVMYSADPSRRRCSAEAGDEVAFQEIIDHGPSRLPS
jgi:hypothetical protein